MDSEQGTPAPVEVEHPHTHSVRDQLARQQQELNAAKLALVEAQVKDTSIPRWKFWVDRPFIPGLERDIQRKESDTASTQEWANERLAEYRQTTEAALPHYQAYVAEQQRLAAETGAEPIVADPSQFILTYEDLRRVAHKAGVDVGKLAATLDFFRPKHDGPVRLPGVESYDNQRIPRLELGSPEGSAAVAKTKEKGLTHMLRIQQDTKMTFGESRDIWRTYPTMDSKQVYIPVSADTAQTLAAVKAEDSVSLYMEGRYKDWPTLKGMIDYRFDVLPLEEAARATEGVSATLSYKQRDWRTGHEQPVTITLRGNTPEELNEQAVRHLIDLEMRPESVVAEGTEVTMGDSKMPWDEFDRLTRPTTPVEPINEAQSSLDNESQDPQSI